MSVWGKDNIAQGKPLASKADYKMPQGSFGAGGGQWGTLNPSAGQVFNPQSGSFVMQQAQAAPQAQGVSPQSMQGVSEQSSQSAQGVSAQSSQDDNKGAPLASQPNPSWGTKLPETSWSGANQINNEGENEEWSDNPFESNVLTGLPSTIAGFKPKTGEKALRALREDTAGAQSTAMNQAQGQAENIWSSMAARGGLSGDAKERIRQGTWRQGMQNQQNLRGNELTSQLQIREGVEKFNQEQRAKHLEHEQKMHAAYNQKRIAEGKKPVPFKDYSISGVTGKGGDFEGADPQQIQDFINKGYEVRFRDDGKLFIDTKNKTGKYGYNLHWNPNTQRFDKHYYRGHPDARRRRKWAFWR